LFDTEMDVFEPGDLALPVVHMGHARVGIMICFDWRFPETARTQTQRGADHIAHPANLVLPHCPESMITRSLENRVYIVTADRVGAENRLPGAPLRFIGQSQVVDPDGEVLIRASGQEEASAVVEIDLERARDKTINRFNDLLRDRRMDLYRLS
ncbi:MAG: nitrilase-related carbon-nitrogen hydrolase, partial [Nitrospinaceae bacterium]